jgi:hypothetical protein
LAQSPSHWPVVVSHVSPCSESHTLVVVAVPVELHAVPVLPLQVPVPGWQTTQPNPLAQVCGGVSAAQFVVVRVPAAQMSATFP